MGLKDLFSAEGRARRSLEKHVARAKNKDSQPEDRRASLDALIEMAETSPEQAGEAVLGLLGRFTMRYDKSIVDEQEKDLVFEALCKRGASILPQLQTHMRRADTISWGLKVLAEVAARDAAWPLLEDLCEKNDNTYTRDPSKKIQLLHFLGEHDDPRAAKALAPYLEDIDEGVRYTAVEGLLHHKVAEAAQPGLLALLVNPKEESRRIKNRILEGFADLGWDVKGQSGTVEKMLADYMPGARLDNAGKIQRPKK
jgi:hypothetical protein